MGGIASEEDPVFPVMFGEPCFIREAREPNRIAGAKICSRDASCRRSKFSDGQGLRGWYSDCWHVYDNDPVMNTVAERHDEQTTSLVYNSK